MAEHGEKGDQKTCMPVIIIYPEIPPWCTGGVDVGRLRRMVVSQGSQ